MRSLTPLWVLGSLASLTIAAVATQASPANATVSPLVLRPPAASRIANPYTIRPDATCKSTGGVSASPCPITLTMSDPAQLVSVSASGSPPPTITEKDNCTQGSNSIATVTPAGTNMYVVSSGTNTGKCKAIFTARDANGKKVGKATLPIDNQFAAP